RIPGVLPTLLDETLRRAAAVFDKAILIGIAVAVDPLQSEFDIGPQRLDKTEGAGSLIISPGQHQGEWGGVYAPVVSAERDLAQGRHLPFARLVQDLSRFGVLLGIETLRLSGAQERQNAPGHSGSHPQTLQSGDDAIPAEWSAEPGHSGIWVGSV